jgi:hypothetical protein
LEVHVGMYFVYACNFNNDLEAIKHYSCIVCVFVFAHSAPAQYNG